MVVFLYVIRRLLCNVVRLWCIGFYMISSNVVWFWAFRGRQEFSDLSSPWPLLSVLSSGPRKTFVLNLMIQQISYVRTYVLFVSYNASYALFRCIRFKFCAFSKMCIFFCVKELSGYASNCWRWYFLNVGIFFSLLKKKLVRVHSG